MSSKDEQVHVEMLASGIAELVARASAVLLMKELHKGRPTNFINILINTNAELLRLYMGLGDDEVAEVSRQAEEMTEAIITEVTMEIAASEAAKNGDVN